MVQRCVSNSSNWRELCVGVRVCVVVGVWFRFNMSQTGDLTSTWREFWLELRQASCHAALLMEELHHRRAFAKCYDAVHYMHLALSIRPSIHLLELSLICFSND